MERRTRKGVKNDNRSSTRLYQTYQNIKARCNYEKGPRFKDYGGRGIKMFKPWENDFLIFQEWANDNGYEDNLTIDRINVNGNYEPYNCRWITNKEQQNNRTNNALFTFNSETKNLKQWSETLGIEYKTLQKRLSKWDIEKAMTEPLKIKGHRLRNIQYTFNNETKTMREWSDITGINIDTLRGRFKSWGIEKALTLPLNKNYQRGKI